MVKIKSFKGLLYNKDKINNDYSLVVAPPYDVISNEKRETLYSKSDFNIIKLILGKETYEKARELLDQWQEKNILVKDNKDAIYVYSQTYEYKNKKITRFGFMCLMKIEEDNEKIVLPHEKTLEKPKKDRMNLIENIEGNLSPIFVLYDVKKEDNNYINFNNLTLNNPIIDIEIEDIIHKIWRITDNETINKIINSLEGKKVFIADGHHRYEVAKQYRNKKRISENYNKNVDYIMAYFSNLSETDSLTIMPTHRVLKNISYSLEEIINFLSSDFSIEECFSENETEQKLYKIFNKKEKGFAFYKNKRFFVIKLINKDNVLEKIKENKSFEWKNLDVSILHFSILKNILNFDITEDNITYVKKFKEAIDLVNNSEYDIAFFLNPTLIDQLRVVAENNEMMPQKSTFFYPKLLTGLVINSFLD